MCYSCSPALTMDNTLHDHRDDSSALDGNRKSHLEETIKNHGQHQDQSLPNISPQSENFKQPHLPLSIRKCIIGWPRFYKKKKLLPCDRMLLQGVCGSIQSLRCIRSAAGRTRSPRMEHRWRRTEEPEMGFPSEVVLNPLLLRCGKQRSMGDSWGGWAMNLIRGSTKGWASYMAHLMHFYLIGCQFVVLNMWTLTYQVHFFIVSRMWKEWNRRTEDGSHSSGVPKKRRAENEVVML